jgi:hypothetical protein
MSAPSNPKRVRTSLELIVGSAAILLAVVAHLLGSATLGFVAIVAAAIGYGMLLKIDSGEKGSPPSARD